MADANDILFGNSAPAVSFDVGTVVRGKITAQTGIQRREVKFDTKTKTHEQGKPLWWKDGKTTTEKTDRPVMDPVLTLQSLFDKWEAVSAQVSRIGRDDGMRRIFVKGRSKANPESLMDAVISACKEAGVRKISPGDFIEIECHGEGEKANKTMNAPKLYRAKYWTAANPPEWAKDLPTDTDDEEPDDDNPFN